MSRFAQIAAEKRPPGKTLMLPAWVWADDWANKPKEAVCIGIRLMADGKKSSARSEAEKIATEFHANGGVNAVDCFNDALMRLLVAHSVCDPNDVIAPFPLLPMAEDEVRDALTSRGARFIFEAYERHEAESSPLNPEANAEDLDELMGLVDAGRIEDLEPSAASLVRRFLRFGLDVLRDGLKD